VRDENLGGARACLVELEFIDRPDIDMLLIWPTAPQVREDLATAPPPSSSDAGLSRRGSHQNAHQTKIACPPEASFDATARPTLG
jgi:hypothetical protein